MGVLIHAFRKLFLKRQINDKEYRQLILSQQKQSMTEQIGVVQQSMSAAKNMLSVFTSNSLASYQNEILNPYKDGNNGVKMTEAQQADAQMKMQQKQAELVAFNYASNSIFEAASTAQLQPLKNADSAIDLEMASLESQLKILRPELDGVEKAEGEEAKQGAPKFGLG